MAAPEQGPRVKADARRQGCAELLPLVYGELRQLAAARMAQEKSGQTLEPTALVHEVFLRLAQEKRGWLAAQVVRTAMGADLVAMRDSIIPRG